MKYFFQNPKEKKILICFPDVLSTRLVLLLRPFTFSAVNAPPPTLSSPPVNTYWASETVICPTSWSIYSTEKWWELILVTPLAQLHR